VGKHAAPEGSAVDPIVAGALARRAGEGSDEEQTPAERTGPVGWPAPPAPDDGGLGWPGHDPAETPADAVARPATEEPTAAPAAEPRGPAAEPRGWRRLLRLRPAA
jgi:hypothetical protein